MPVVGGAATTAVMLSQSSGWSMPLVFSSFFGLQVQTGGKEEQVFLSRTRKWQLWESSRACSLQHFALLPLSACCQVLEAGCADMASCLFFWRSYLLGVFPPGPWVTFPQSLEPAVDVPDTTWVSKPLSVFVISEALEVWNTNRQKSLGRIDNKTKQTEKKMKHGQEQAVKTDCFISWVLNEL